MSLLSSVPPTFRRHATRSLRRSFHSSPTSHASIFYALSALSNSRETQHFNKLTKLPRMEHSPPLKLIKTSEIDAYPCPTPPRPPRPLIRHVGGARSAARIWDHRALQVGRVILSNQARQTHRLLRSLARAKRREFKLNALSKQNQLAWQAERSKMRREMKAAGVWILGLIATATVLATWRFWPEGGARPMDSGELGRKIAARASAALSVAPAPAISMARREKAKETSGESVAASRVEPAVSIEPTITAPVAVPVAASQTETRRPAIAPATENVSTGSWWRSLFWKQ